MSGYSEFPQFPNSSCYHPFCEILDYNDQDEVEDCWLGLR